MARHTIIKCLVHIESETFGLNVRQVIVEVTTKYDHSLAVLLDEIIDDLNNTLRPLTKVSLFTWLQVARYHVQSGVAQ